LQFALLSLLIVCELLLFLAERLSPLPPWFHLCAVITPAAFVLALAALSKKRDACALQNLRQEVNGMQQKMAKAARRYKSLLEGAGNAIFVFNADSGALEEANHSGIELLGFSKEELSAMLGRDLLHPDEHERFRSVVYQLKRHGRADTEGLKFQRKDGSLFLGEIDGRLIDLGDEQVVHCILRDITEKRRTEREIWQRNRELSILNDILTNLSGDPGEEGGPERTLNEIMELFQAGGGTIHQVGGASETPRLWAAHEVSRQLSRRLSALIAAEPERFRAVSVQAGEADGWGSLTCVPLISHEQLVGVIHLLHRSPHHYSGEEFRFLESVGKQLGGVIEKRQLFAELNRKSAELLRSHRLLEKASHNLHSSEIKLKKNLALVEQANRELSRLDRMKNQFLGMVSHEFNTPLTSIISGADHLLQQAGVESGEEAAVLEMVRDGGLRLKELVADLLRLIRLEAHQGELASSAVHLERLLESMQEQFRPQLERRGQKVRLSGLSELPFFEGDRDYLERVFSELLLNAMRFSPQGGEIEVAGRVVLGEELRKRRQTLERFNAGFLKRCGDRCYLEVAVRDRGIGVPPEEQQRIFDIFYEVGEIRHHSSGSGRFQGKGAGLGLAMVKGMVEAHGGMVWVESGEGSSFFVVLPLEQEASQPALF